MTEQLNTESSNFVPKLINVDKDDLKTLTTCALSCDYLTYGQGGMKLFIQDFFSFCAGKPELLKEFSSKKK